MKKYLIAVWLPNGESDIYVFATKKDRLLFLKEVQKLSGKVHYAFSDIVTHKGKIIGNQ